MKAALWAAAVSLYGVGDLATTLIALRLGGVERHPVAAQAIAEFGGGILVGWTIVSLGLFGAAYVALQRLDVQARIGIPIGLSILGLAICANNLRVIAVLAGWVA